MVEREIKKIGELIQLIIDGFNNLERAVKAGKRIMNEAAENMNCFCLQNGINSKPSLAIRFNFVLASVIEQCAANVLESDYVYEFERVFWFKDLSRYERRKLINKVFGVGFFNNLSLSLKLRILKY